MNADATVLLHFMLWCTVHFLCKSERWFSCQFYHYSANFIQISSFNTCLQHVMFLSIMELVSSDIFMYFVNFCPVWHRCFRQLLIWSLWAVVSYWRCIKSWKSSDIIYTPQWKPKIM